MFRYASRIGLFLCVVVLAGLAHAQVRTDIKQGDSTVSALVLGEGDHAVIAFHGSVGGPEVYFSPGNGGNIGTELAKAGFKVISVAWSGTGQIHTTAAVRFAKESGAKKVSLLGQSTGTLPVADYAAVVPEGELDTVILVSAKVKKAIPLTKTKKLFVYSKSDRQASFDAPVMAEQSAEPKQIFALDGGAHPIGQMLGARSSLIQDVIDVLRK